jgi:hypothetical protein
VPKAGSHGILQELLPPFAMGFCPGKAFKRFKISPILAHPDVQWKQRVEKILVKKQAIGSSGNRAFNLVARCKV